MSLKVRNLVNQSLRTDSDLNAFIIDHFPELWPRFSNAMDRTAKVNLLFELAKAENVYQKLQMQNHQLEKEKTGEIVIKEDLSDRSIVRLNLILEKLGINLKIEYTKKGSTIVVLRGSAAEWRKLKDYMRSRRLLEALPEFTITRITTQQKNNATPVDRSITKNLKFSREIVRDVNPTVLEYKNYDGDVYLFTWCDHVDGLDKWLAFRVDGREYIKYLFQQVSLLWLLINSKDEFVFLIDMDQNSQMKNIAISSIDELSPEYYPQDLIYESQLTPPEYIETDMYPILLNKNLNFDQLGDFPKLYKYAYAYLYMLGPTPQHPNISDFGYDWAGRGFVVRPFFNELHRQIPKEKRLKVQEVEQKSPGYLKINMDAKIGSLMTATIRNFESQRGRLYELYYFLYKWSKPLDAKPTEDIEKAFYGLIRIFGGLNENKLKYIFHAAPRDAVLTLLMYYRRIKDLSEYETTGWVTYV